MATKMPKVEDCSATECSYNADGSCHAMAINIGGSEPLCDTYYKGGKKGGITSIIGGVGACHVEKCTFNDALECSANGIHVNMAGPRALCATFKSQ
jgi:hypothetical protein